MPIDSAIRNIINDTGRITIDEMMSQVLTSSHNSYYMNLKDIGRGGDFITSPEISQFFGESVGLWVVDQWQKLGKPKHFTLLELGPGKGSLMRDLLKSVLLVPGLIEKMDIRLYDVNPYFIDKQKNTLESYISDYGDKIQWVDSFEDLSEHPIIILSNEFFDALPVKQYTKIKDIWYESVLVVDPVDSQIKYDKVALKKSLQEYLQAEHRNATDGAVLEESPESLDLIRRLARKVKKQRGSFLAIDYGYYIETQMRTAEQYSSTLQAIKDHQYQPIIDTLGEADLSAHVDFSALIKAAYSSGVTEFNMTSQGNFLKEYGILIRLESLIKKYTNHLDKQELASNLGKQVYRLTSPDQMGELFKVLRFWNYT